MGNGVWSAIWDEYACVSNCFCEKSILFFLSFQYLCAWVFMCMNAGPLYLLSMYYLIAFWEREICQFHPEKTVDLPQPLPKATCVWDKVQTHLQLPMDLPSWPDTNNACSIAPSDGLPEFVSLSFNMTIPNYLSLEESVCIVWTCWLLDRYSCRYSAQRQGLQAQVIRQCFISSNPAAMTLNDFDNSNIYSLYFMLFPLFSHCSSFFSIMPLNLSVKSYAVTVISVLYV